MILADLVCWFYIVSNMWQHTCIYTDTKNYPDLEQAIRRQLQTPDGCWQKACGLGSLVTAVTKSVLTEVHTHAAV